MFIGIAINLTGRLLSAASPASLFAAGEQGVWYDPSDLTTLFQDSAGTTPVTAPAQPVGRMLDKSGRGNHATQATSAQRPIYGINPVVGTRNLQTQTENFAAATWTKNVCTVSVPSTPPPARGGVYGRITSTGAFANMASPFVFVALTQYTISGVLKKVTASTASMLVENLALIPRVSINLSTGAVTSSNCTYTSTLVGTDEYFVTMTFTTPAVVIGAVFRWWVGIYSNPDTSGQSFDLAAPQIELGSTATAYQKVVTQYEVTQANTASVSYLAFDGMVTGMVTGNVNFSATDAVTIWSGLRKLSDAARGMVVELTAGAANSFQINAPATASQNYDFKSQGQFSSQALSQSFYPAPLTSVLTGQGKISTDVSILRINGTQVVSNSTDQGTGNYANAPLYIGRRGGTTLPFNGNLYSLIVRGVESTGGQITSTESWVNGKTGAY